MSASEKLWLLRINDTVYGPFNKEKVVDLITKGRVSEIDEASLPKNRWSYVRDHQEFMGALELQRKIQSRKSGSYHSNSGTETEALSVDESDQTKEVSSSIEISKTLPNPTISVENLKPSLRAGAQAKGVKRGGKSKQSKFVKKSKSRVRTLLLFVLIVILLGGFYFFESPDTKNFFSDILKTEFENSFMVSWKNGDYKSAYESIVTKDSLIKSYEMEYVSLILINELNGKKARSWLDKSLNKSNEKWKLLSGLSYLYEGKLNEAESELKAVKTQKDNLELATLYNLGVLHYLKKDWSQAKMYFESVFSRQKKNEFQSAGLLLVDSWIQDSINSQTISEDLGDLSKFIKNIYSSSPLYRYELYFTASWLDGAFGTSIASSEEFSQSFMNLDPEIIFNRWHSPYIYLFNGKNIDRYCSGQNSYNSELYFSLSCKIVSLRKNAIPPQYNNLSAYSSDELALISFLLDKKDQVVDANDVLIKSLEKKDEKSPLKYFVQARFCQKNGNFKCAAENWMKSLSLNSNSPTAFVGLSFSYLAVNDIQRAQMFYEKAKFLSEGLVDFKKLEHEMLKKN